MKLTTTTQVSVDGVMQGPGLPVAGVAERGGFERDGWAHFDDEAGTVMDEIYERADGFLFGRRTYEIFAASWGTLEELRSHVAQKIGPIAKPANVVFTPELPKTRSGKIMRRLLRDVAEQRPLGDTTTLADPSVVDEISHRAAAETAEE